MLTFNEYGLLPEGIHSVDLEQFEELFGFNEKRKEMIKNGLHPSLNELKRYDPGDIYVDGSFVTKHENPNDIDGYVITDTGSNIYHFIVENQERWRLEYRVDFYWALTDVTGESSKEWWETVAFPRVSEHPSRKKGYVVLKVPGKRG
jgi:hypothetical protein